MTERRANAARWCLVVAVAAASLVAHGADAETKSKMKGKARTQEQQAATPAELPNKGLKAFGDMIPLGRQSKGVRIPAFEDGKPSTLIVADSLIRVDDNRLFAEKLSIKMFGAMKEQDVKVDLKTGTYNMDHQILSSTERSRVSRSDFEIEGDGMVFDTKTSQGKMVGNVKMVIFDMKKTMSSNPGSGPATKPAPAPEAAPATSTIPKQ